MRWRDREGKREREGGHWGGTERERDRERRTGKQRHCHTLKKRVGPRKKERKKEFGKINRKKIPIKERKGRK